MDDMETRVTAIERDLCNLREIVLEERRRSNNSLDKIDQRLTELNTTMHQVRTEALGVAAAKPTWGVTFALGVMASICTGFAVYIVTHL